MDKTMRQRRLQGKDIVTVGAKVDTRLHAIIKETALKKGVSMSWLVEEALAYYVENVLDVNLNKTQEEG